MRVGEEQWDNRKVGKEKKKKKKEDGERKRMEEEGKHIELKSLRLEFHMDFQSTLALLAHGTRVSKI